MLLPSKFMDEAAVMHASSKVLQHMVAAHRNNRCCDEVFAIDVMILRLL